VKKIIASCCVSIAFILSSPAQADTTTTDKASIEQEKSSYKEALKTYRGAMKVYRNAQVEARTKIQIARKLFRQALKNASTPEARLEAMTIFRSAKTAALALVPKKPLKPIKPTN
jgi:tetratricopeptide (TPR) repeat protein